MDKQEEPKGIETEIYLMDIAIKQLSEDKQLIVRLRYIEGNKDSYVQRLLKKEHGVKSRDKYYSLKDEAVLELAGTFGYLKEGKEDV